MTAIIEAVIDFYNRLTVLIQTKFIFSCGMQIETGNNILEHMMHFYFI